MRLSVIDVGLTSLVVGLFLTADVLASAPRDVDDLVGDRASSGERELKHRGYRFIKNLKTSNAIIGYWWNSRRDACIAVTTKDGHYKSILNQPEVACEKSGHGEHGRDHRRHHSSRPKLRVVEHGNVEVDVGDCTTMFAREGGLKHKESSCSPDDIAEAREAFRSYVREQRAGDGDEAPAGGWDRDDGRRHRGHHSSTPEVRVVDNGRVAVDVGGCTVLFAAEGGLKHKGSSCSRDDVDRAREAFRSYVREQRAGDGH